MTFQDWIPIILALIAAGPGLAALRSQKQKDKREDIATTVDNAGKVTSQALALIGPLNTRITELEQKVITLRAEGEERDKKIEEQDEVIENQDKRLRESEAQIRRLKLGVKKLIDQIIRLGHIPDWQPDFIEGE